MVNEPALLRRSVEHMRTAEGHVRKEPRRLEENIGAVHIELTADDLREVDEAAAKITIHGAINPPDPRHGITLLATVSEFLSAPASEHEVKCWYGVQGGRRLAS